MNWKTKRLAGTLIWAIIPYVAVTFVSLDPLFAFATPSNRLVFGTFTLFAAFAAFTYPGWKWPND